MRERGRASTRLMPPMPSGPVAWHDRQEWHLVKGIGHARMG